MESVFFYLFAALTLLCGVLVIANPFTRSPVTSAMFLILTIISMAGLFVLLHAFFLSAVQVLVYAGAVMVVFVFVIMLLDLKEEEQRRIKISMAILGVLSVAMIAFAMIRTLKQSSVGLTVGDAVFEGSPEIVGQSIFTEFALPFEILSLLLLVAVIGTVLLSKRDLK